MRWNSRPVGAWTLVLLWTVSGCRGLPGVHRGGSDLRQALTFHASFDTGTDADLAVGDAWIYHAPGMDQWSEARPGLPAEGPAEVVPGGRFGGALHFSRPTGQVLFYRGGPNIPWQARDWSGTVSFWLRTDLDLLPEGFSDPAQLTPRGWNDAAFFVEFEHRPPSTVFRLGAYPDFRVWNPRNLEWKDFPASALPLIAVPGPPFYGDRWTHVAFTWSQVNTGSPDSRVVLYLDGGQVGTLVGRPLTFTWDPRDSRLLLGVGFTGWMDDLAVFNRALDASEIQQIRSLPAGIRSLR